MIAVTMAARLLLMNFIGIFIRKIGIADQNFVSRLTDFMMKITIPCMIFTSVSGAMPFSMEALTNCGAIIVMAVITIVISLAIGQVVYMKCKDKGMGRIMRFGLTFTHFSSTGIPIVETLFGELGTFYYAFFLVGVRLIYYCIFDRLMTPPEVNTQRKGFWKSVKTVALNPSLLAVVIGVIFWVSGWHLPGFIDACVTSLGSTSSTLGLLLCGMLVAGHDFKRVLRLKYLILGLVRTIIMPALFFGLTRLFLHMDVDPMLFKLVVIYAALPVSGLMPVYAAKFDPDPENHLNAAASTMVSVLLSAITIPIWYSLL